MKACFKKYKTTFVRDHHVWLLGHTYQVSLGKTALLGPLCPSQCPGRCSRVPVLSVALWVSMLSWPVCPHFCGGRNALHWLSPEP